MITDLFVIASGIDPDAVMRAVPPSCRRPIDPRPAVTTASGDTVIESPIWTPRSPARHFVPAFALLSQQECSIRFELAVDVAGEWSPWVGAASIGSSTFTPIPSNGDTLHCDIDVFTSRELATRVRYRVRVRTDGPTPVSSLHWLATLSACDLATDGASRRREPGRAARRVIDVPALSQMEAPSSLRHRICSPTSVAMVLGRWDRPTDPATLAAEMFHAALDLYGVWPAAIRAAGRRGVAGYLLRFPDWESAAWCLENGVPIVASVRYEAGELSGAAIPATEGHVLVVTGYDGDDVLVNDPAAPSRAEVPRRYRRDEILDVWLRRAGVGYVFFEV